MGEDMVLLLLYMSVRGCDVGHDGIFGGRARLNGGMWEDGDGGGGDGELLELIFDVVVKVGGARKKEVDGDAACFLIDGFATFGGGDDVGSIEKHGNAHDATRGEGGRGAGGVCDWWTLESRKNRRERERER